MGGHRGRRGAALGVWAQAWRLAGVYLAGWVALGVMVQLASGQGATIPPPRQLLLVADLGVGHLAMALYAVRRRPSLTVAAVLAALTAVSAFALAPAVAALVALAIRRRSRELALVAGPWLAATLAHESLVVPALDGSGVPELGRLALVVVVTVAALAVAAYVGWSLGVRRELLAFYTREAETARREQASRVAEGRLEERNRIAREVHDVLAHRLSLVAMHAGVLATRTDLPPEDLVASAETVRRNSHLALEELRTALGSVGVDGDPTDTGTRPQPALSDIPGLVAEASTDDQPVVLLADPELWAQAHLVPTTTGRHSYRIVQESLTNARKHGGAGPVRVRLSGGAGRGLHVEVTNPMPASPGELVTPPGSGKGLAGMSERAASVGGTLAAGATRTDFLVRAQLPWPSPEGEQT